MSVAPILIVMGVSGSGKSTIGRLLAHELGLPYFDGDDYHPANNVLKMSAGEPLNDNDRQEWLNALNELAVTSLPQGAVIACSALKERYRAVLRETIEDSVRFVYLQGSFEEVFKRMTERKDHFMPVNLLKSQFEILEPPEGAICVSIKRHPEEIIQEILDQLQ
ncbi:MAG: gluconokinase [Aurantibacter sp.]